MNARKVALAIQLNKLKWKSEITGNKYKRKTELNAN